MCAAGAVLQELADLAGLASIAAHFGGRWGVAAVSPTAGERLGEVLGDDVVGTVDPADSAVAALVDVEQLHAGPGVAPGHGEVPPARRYPPADAAA